MKLCLGTVQFGMEYGIRKFGQPTRADALEMLEFAINNDVCAIDTASVYGTAEIVVGEFIKNNPNVRNKIEIISKLSPNALEGERSEYYFTKIQECINQSLNNLHIDYLDVYLLHNPDYLFNDKAITELINLKNTGLTKKVGVSVYTPDEAIRGIECGLDILQIPYSIFDQRMDEQGIFELATKKNIELHSRSAFTQGLMLMDESDIPSSLKEMQSIIRKYSDFCEKEKLSRVEIALAFVCRHSCIKKLVFGVDNIIQLSEIINAYNKPVHQSVLDEASKIFAGINEKLVSPVKWN